jgi:hypothetical protein
MLGLILTVSCCMSACQTKRGQAKGCVNQSTEGETAPDEKGLKVGTPPLRVDNSFDQSPHGIAEKPGCDEQEHRTTKTEVSHSP